MCTPGARQTVPGSEVQQRRWWTQPVTNKNPTTKRCTRQLRSPGEEHMSIPVFPKLWDTELLWTECARNYWLPQVPVNLSQFTWVPVDLSPRRLSVDRRQNYLARVLFDSSPRRLSINRRWNYLAPFLVNLSPRRQSVDRPWKYLARVPVVCSSTDVGTDDSHHSHLSLYRLNLQQLTS